MPLSRPTRPLEIRSLGAGLNLAVEALAARSDETTAERNMEHSGPYARTKRYGTEAYADIYTSGGCVRGQYVWQRSDGTAQHIAAFDTGTQVDLCKEINGVWTAFATGLTTGTDVGFTSAIVPVETPIDSGTATSSTSSSLVDTGKTWTTDQYRGYFLKLTSGQGAGQIRLIATNATTSLKISEPWETTPTSTTTYEILATEDILIYGNGVENTSRYNGTAAPTAISGAPRSNVLTYWQERLFIAVNDTISYSAEYANYTANLNVAEIARSMTASPITSLYPHPTESTLLVFTTQDVRRTSFTTISSKPVLTLSDPIDNYGAVSARTICTAGNDVIYLSSAGVRIYGQQAQYTGLRVDDQVSTNIAPLIAQIVNPTATAAVYADQRYYLACQLDSTSTANDTVLVLDTRYPSTRSPRGAWKHWDGISAATLTEYADRVHYGLASDGRVIRQCTADSVVPYADLATTAIASSITTKSFDLKDPFTEKYFQYLDLQLRNLSGALTITIDVEDQTGRTIESFDLSVGVNLSNGSIGTFELGFGLYGTGESGSTIALADYVQERLGLAIDGHRIRFSFANSGLGENFTLTAVTCWYKYHSSGRQALDSQHQLA